MTREGEHLGTGRLLGLRRGGPEPPQTRKGAPLRPFTPDERRRHAAAEMRKQMRRDAEARFDAQRAAQSTGS